MGCGVGGFHLAALSDGHTDTGRTRFHPGNVVMADKCWRSGTGHLHAAARDQLLGLGQMGTRCR